MHEMQLTQIGLAAVIYGIFKSLVWYLLKLTNLRIKFNEKIKNFELNAKFIFPSPFFWLGATQVLAFHPTRRPCYPIKNLLILYSNPYFTNILCLVKIIGRAIHLFFFSFLLVNWIPKNCPESSLDL